MSGDPIFFAGLGASECFNQEGKGERGKGEGEGRWECVWATPDLPQDLAEDCCPKAIN